MTTQHNYDEFVVSLAQEMIRTPTVNPPGNELRLAERLQQVMTEGGLTTTLYPLSSDRASVVGRLTAGTGNKPAFAMVGHIDTVAPGEAPWSFDAFSGEIKDGKLCGRGASDMKSGTAAMIAAAVNLASTDIQLQGDLIVACTAGEEVDCAGAIDLLAQGVFDDVGAMLIPEPSNLAVYHAEKGALWMKIVTYGKTAHGSMPREGDNAIDRMLPILEKIRTLSFSHASHPLLGSPTISIGTISGGIKVNVVPDRCETTVDLRTMPGEDHSRLVAEIQQLASENSRDEVQSPEVTAIVDRPAIEVAPDDPLVQAARAAVSKITCRETELGGATYFSDAAVLTPTLDIPMVICGPGKPELAHQPDEYVDIDRLIQASRIYQVLVRKMLAHC